MIETGEDRSKFEEIYYEYRNLMYFIAYGDSECGPNGSKKVFLNVGKTFLRALAKDLGLRDAMVSANPGGIAVSGECTLIGMSATAETIRAAITVISHAEASRSGRTCICWIR